MMKVIRSKAKILVGILVVGVLVISGYLVFTTLKPVKVEFPIDSKEEAIAYAKTDPDVKKFIESCSTKGWRVNSWAYFIENENIWEVGFEAQPVKDVFFVIRFKPDGTIISKGPSTI